MRDCLYNTRFVHTFQDEDAIGTVKKIARACHRRLLELRVLGRWMLYLKAYSQGRTNEPLRRNTGWNRPRWAKKSNMNIWAAPQTGVIYDFNKCHLWMSALRTNGCRQSLRMKIFLTFVDVDHSFLRRSAGEWMFQAYCVCCYQFSLIKPFAQPWNKDQPDR